MEPWKEVGRQREKCVTFLNSLGFLILKLSFYNLLNRKKSVGGHFPVRSHVLFPERVTLLDPGLYRELHPELNIGPHNPMASSISFDLQNG